MEDLIAILALATECAISILVVHYMGGTFPVLVAVVIFVVLTFIGLGVWDKRSLEEWRKLSMKSLVLGLGFFGIDVLLAHLRGQTIFQFPGGLLGLPLTLITWGFAMVSLARARYLSRNEQCRNQKLPPPP